MTLPIIIAISSKATEIPFIGAVIIIITLAALMGMLLLVITCSIIKTKDIYWSGRLPKRIRKFIDIFGI